MVLGKNVSNIDTYAFSDTNIKEFYVTSDKFLDCSGYVFSSIDLSGATLYVPEALLSYYQKKYPWTNFGKVLALSGEDVFAEPCATPSISYNGEDIVFDCGTEGATIHYTITPADTISGTTDTGKVSISGIYEVTAYATADGKSQSETVTEQLKCATGVVEVQETIYIYDDTRSEIKLATGETITLSVINGVIHIEDAPLNSIVNIYTVDGMMYASESVSDKVSSFVLPRNAIYIIKVGGKTFKVKL